MPTYSVDTAAVADTAARTRTRIATIQTEVDGMRGDIGLLQSCWTGTASDSMAACAADWHLTQIQVQSNLDQISLALDNAAVCYDDAETTNQGRFATPTPAPATGPAPAPAPATTKSVFFDTEEVAFPPWSSTASWADSRENPGTVPVTTTVSPSKVGFGALPPGVEAVPGLSPEVA